MTPLAELKHRFWDPRSSYGVGPPLTAATLAAAEERLGRRLPAAYVELLAVQNGGQVSRDFHVHAAIDGDLTALAGIGPAQGHTILESPEMTRTWKMPKKLVLLTGDGHTWLALDYRGRRRAEPSVVWWDNDDGRGTTVAPDFRTYVEALRPGEPEPSADLDRPPHGALIVTEGALSAAIAQLEEDLDHLRSGARGLENTKQWCRARVEPVYRHLPKEAERTIELMRAVREAPDADALGAIVRDGVIPELERLMPFYVGKRKAGYALDEAYLAARRPR